MKASVASIVTDSEQAITGLCRQYGVESLDVFGSAATGTFDEQTSDADFIVTFADMSAGIANRYLDFAEALERPLGRPVDVMVDGPIRNPYLRQSVEATRENVCQALTCGRYPCDGQLARISTVSARGRHARTAFRRPPDAG